MGAYFYLQCNPQLFNQYIPQFQCKLSIVIIHVQSSFQLSIKSNRLIALVLPLLRSVIGEKFSRHIFD